MNLKNFFKPGDLVMPVPVGIKVTLQYDDKGTLTNVYYGLNGDKSQDATDNLLSTLIDYSIVPKTIPIQYGYTYICGVLYTANKSFDSSETSIEFNQILQKPLVDLFLKSPDSFIFYAGNIDSHATKFNGAATIKQWLSMHGFNVLPSFLLSTLVTESQFNDILSKTCSFRPLIISDYIIFDINGASYASANLSEHIVSKITTEISENGSIKAKIYYKNENNYKLTDYTDVTKYNILANNIIICDDEDKVIYSCPIDNKIREPRPHKWICTVCGRQFNIPDKGVLRCPDNHCMSNKFNDAVHMIDTLGLPELHYDEYKKLVSDKSIVSIVDILDTSKYKDITISTSLPVLLRSIISSKDIPNDDTLVALANRCSNNVSALRYYIHHPDKISSDLDITGDNYIKLYNWFSDVENLQDVEQLLDSPNVQLTVKNKLFEGAPIFYKKKILLTGNFIHGDTEHIVSILESYSATIVTDFSSDIYCVVFGSKLEGINSSLIKKARMYNIPVYEENTFFKQFEIDKDLQKNLL